MSEASQQMYMNDLVAFAIAADEKSKQISIESVEGRVFTAYCKVRGSRVLCKDVAAAALADVDEHDWQTKRKFTAQSVSAMLRSMGFETKHTKFGSEVSITDERFRALCERFSVDPDKPGSGLRLPPR